MKQRRERKWVAVAAGLGFLLSGWVTTAFAQAPAAEKRVIGPVAPAKPPRGPAPFLAEGRSEEELALDGVFLPPDRTAKRRLEMAQQMLEDRRFGEAVRLLGSLLENSEDFFFKPQSDQPVFHSLKAEAGQLIGGLSSEGRDSYELQFGARARQLLKQAATSGNLSEVAEVARRFFYTQAGQEATFLLGRHHLDQNRPMAAALCLERLNSTPGSAQRLEPMVSLTLATCWMRAGMPEKAKETLVRLKRALGPAEILLAGKPVKLFSADAQALAWLEETLGKQRPAHAVEADQWTMFRGNESRNAPSAGGQPLLSVRWRQRTADDRAVEKFVSKVRHDYMSQDIAALPSMHPLAIGDVVVMRTAFALQAVDFHHGKLVWKYHVLDDSLEQFSKAGSSQTGGAAQQLFAGLDQRMWEDATYGTLSSDGAYVFFVEDLTLAGGNTGALLTVLPNGQRRSNGNPRGVNRLAARELRTQGKLKWEVGGITGEDEPKLAGAFFLGPPLPLMGNLYALVEMKGQEIRLVALSPQTGALQWSQQLAVVDRSVESDSFRRNAGANPSFSDGVLVCPTSAGAIVAVDLTSRSLLWGYQYPRAQSYPQERFQVRFNYPGTERRINERWADGSITISAGHVLVTPVETDQLYCLSLLDGKELWKQNRGNHLYVGCVHRGNVILIGHNGVSALRLSDGEKAWPNVLELPSGSMPSGRGFYSGDYYYLPLTTAEVAKINLQTGRIEQRVRSRSGSIPGNLICYRDSIISQGVDYLDVYFQIEALKQVISQTLQKHPEDPQALAGLGEIKINEEQLAEAIDLFRRSYRLMPEEATREQLIESLLEGLRVDFAAHRESLAELDSLIEQPQHRLVFLRQKAAGLQAAGDFLPAFETYMKLLDQGAPWTLDVVEGPLMVRRDRWIRSRIEQLREIANDSQRQQIDEMIVSRSQAALAGQSPDALRAFLAAFGSHRSTEAVRGALVEKLAADDLLERTLLLGKHERSADEATRAVATARLASILREAARPELAAVYYRQLAEKFSQRDCGDGKTGQQWVADLSANDPVRKWISNDQGWPTGKVTAREEKKVTLNGRPTVQPSRTVDLEISGPSGSLFQGVSMSLVFERQLDLMAQNGLGEKRFRIPLPEVTGRTIPMVNRNPNNAPVRHYVSVNGGLVVLTVGNQVMAIDTVRGDDGPSSRVLWTQELNDQVLGYPNMQGVTSRPVNVPWGGVRYVTEDAFGRRFGGIGPVNDDGICFQWLHDLHCVDPLTGKPIWTRKNVGLGNDLFGDEEVLFVAPMGEGDTLVLRAATGEVLGARRIASFENRIITLGRRVLSWETQNGQPLLQMRDAWLDQTLWSYPFAAGSKADLASQEAIGVYQPNGEFSLITLADGKVLVKEQLEPENALQGVYLLRWRDGYLLVTNTTARTESSVMVQAIPNSVNATLITGRLHAFDQTTGKKAWPEPVVISQQGMLLSQPCDLPVLVFAKQTHRSVAGGMREPKIAVLCIDKRTGRVVYENEQLPGPAVPNFELSGDFSAKTVSLAFASRTITLTFTNEPLVASEPTEDPKKDEPKPQGSGVEGSSAEKEK